MAVGSLVSIDTKDRTPIYALNFLCLPNIPDVGVTDQGIIETATMELLPTVVQSR